MNKNYPMDSLIIKAIIAKLPDIQAIYRYGSAGSVYERKDSDVDIAFLINRTVSFQEMSELSLSLAQLTSKDVDLHNMKDLPVTLRVQIIFYGVRIYCKDNVAAEAYDSYTLSDYVRLNEERHFILEDIRQREQIYG